MCFSVLFCKGGSNKNTVLVPRVVKFIETEGRMVFASDGTKEGKGKLLLNGYRVSVWEDENVLEMDGSDGCTTM